MILNVTARSQSSNYTGLAAYSKNQQDVYSFIVQPAVLARGQVPGAGMVAEQKYLMKELMRTNLMITVPVDKGGFGIMAGTQSGAYRQQQASLSYGRVITDQVDLGARFSWDSFSAIGYPRMNEYAAGLGINITLTEFLSTGAFACASFGSNTSNNGISTRFRLGLGYDLSSLVHITMQLIKENTFPASIVAGIHYQLAKAIWIRTGIDSNFSGWWFGAGFNIKQLRIDLVNNYHPQLGPSPAIAVHYPFKKPQRL